MRGSWGQIVYLLKLIGSLKLQRKLWIEESSSNLAFSYEETCKLLDKYSYWDEIAENSLQIPQEQLLYIIEFNERLLAYNGPKDNEDMLTDTDWLIIVVGANMVVEIIKKALALSVQ